MPTVPANTPSSNITTSSEVHGIDYEPDDEWKLQLWKKIIEAGFQPMIASAKENQAAELRKSPDTPEARMRIEANCKQAMQNIRRLATKQYLLELDRERNRRRWKAGVPMNPDWAQHLIEEQRNVMRSIEQSSNQPVEWGSFMGGSSRTISYSTDRHPSRSPPPRRPSPEIWMPAISPTEDVPPAETYNLERRGSAASMRSTGSGANIRPSITKTIPATRADERPYESATEGSDYERTIEQGRAWISTDKPHEQEKQPHIRRNSRPSPIDTSLHSSAMQSTTSPTPKRPLSAKPSLTLVNDDRQYPNDIHGKPGYTSPRDPQPEDQQLPSARPIPLRSSYSDDRDYVSPYSTLPRPRGPRLSSQREFRLTSHRTSFSTRQPCVDIDNDDNDRGMDQERSDQERLRDRDYDEETDRDRGTDMYSEQRRGSKPVSQSFLHTDELYDDRMEWAGPSRGRDRYSYRRLTPDNSQYQRPPDNTREHLVRQEVDNFRREVKRKAEEAKQKESPARKEEGRKGEDSKPMAEHQFRKREEDIKRSREGKRNNSGGNNRAWSSSLHFTPLPGTSPGISKTPPQFNGTPFQRRSASAPTRGAGPAPARSPSIKPTPSPTPNASAGKPRTSSVSYGTYPMRRSPHTTSFSEPERTRKLQEFAESLQEQLRRTQEKLEAERQLTSVGLSQKQSQRIFEHHERLWNRLNTLSELTWTDFPWPMAKPPLKPDDISLPLIGAYILSPVYPDKDKSITIQDRIMEHIRRWGPVRFETKLLPKVVEDEREKVKLAARNVATYLCDLLRKENESNNSMNNKKDMEMEESLRWREEELMRREEVKRTGEEEAKRKNRYATSFDGREVEPLYRGGNSAAVDSDDDSSEDEAETKRIRDLEAKMRKLEEDKRAAENELDRIKVELQRLIDKAAKEDEETRRREEEVTKKEQDAEKREEAVKRKEDEARRKAEDLSRKEEEVMQKAAQIQLEAQKIAKDTLKKKDDLKKMEDLMRRKVDKEAAAREEAGKEGNMLVTGGAFHIAEGDIHINGSGKSLTDKGITKLFLKVASGAFHDSGELSDPLMVECHPNNRIAAIQEILDWLDDPKSPELVMWLNGATGAGKSAIAQTVAQVLSERGELSGSFFFARGTNTGRSDERRLVPTLAYQLAKYLPDTRFHIAMTVVSDPAIFDLALRRQVQDLLINPLRSPLNAASSTSPRLYIIDGLDECRSADVQCLILQVFADAVKSLQHHLPHKLLITSRSEMHLLAGFNNTATTYRQLSLDNSCLSG